MYVCDFPFPFLRCFTHNLHLISITTKAPTQTFCFVFPLTLVQGWWRCDITIAKQRREKIVVHLFLTGLNVLLYCIIHSNACTYICIRTQTEGGGGQKLMFNNTPLEHTFRRQIHPPTNAEVDGMNDWLAGNPPIKI